MENKFGNYLVCQLYSKLDKKYQILLSSYLSNIDEHISDLNCTISSDMVKIIKLNKKNYELENQIKDLQKEVYNLQIQNGELRNERNFDLDNYKLIIAEIKDPETISAIAKAVLKHGKS